MSKCIPKVDNVWEIREIANDFTKPLEVFREAISNAYDADATEIRIEVYKEKEGKYKYSPLIIKISDNGKGMNENQIENFWSLGFSEKRNTEDEHIGCKGHGTMIYLKSKYVQLQTTNSTCAYKSYCEEPMQKLLQGKMYEPEIEEITTSPHGTGTEIILEGFIDNETAFAKQINFDDIRDYILWFTKHGSIEKEFDIKKRKNCKLFLKVYEKEEWLDFGHVFAKVNDNISKLKKEYEDESADYYVKKYCKKGVKLEEFPSYKCDIVLYYEGTEARKLVNPSLKENDYTEASRYGLYLCKDYIPIDRVNHWIKSFNKGSGGYVRLHGFVNCQDFYLTANRGSVSINNKDVMDAIEKRVDECIKDFIKELKKSGLYDFVQEMTAVKNLEDENEAFYFRKNESEKKNFYDLTINNKNISLYEPRNENELFYIYTILSTIKPEVFPFTPVDYNTNKGIDMLVRTQDQMYGREYAYVELKHILKTKPFNHSFSNLAFILCWKISDKVEDNQEFESEIDGKNKKWIIKREKNGSYLKEKGGGRINIQIIEIKPIFDELINKEKNKKG